MHIISVSNYDFLFFKFKINRNLDADTDTQGWKIAGIAMGAIVVIIGIILVLLTIFKQARNRPWRYKKEENLDITDEYYGDVNIDDDQTHIEDFDDDTRIITPPSNKIRSPIEGNTRETASSPMQDPLAPPSDLKTLTSDIIFCPGCNRSHPSSHQCMYSTRVANGFATPFQPKQVPQHDSIAIQTDEDGKIQKKLGTHTVIDRTLKYSNTTQTQTDVSANPRSNITESIILRRVPIPTAKVVVQQPTTKVMIVKVPNVAGQLVIQPKSESRE